MLKDSEIRFQFRKFFILKPETFKKRKAPSIDEAFLFYLKLEKLNPQTYPLQLEKPQCLRILRHGKGFA